MCLQIWGIILDPLLFCVEVMCGSPLLSLLNHHVEDLGWIDLDLQCSHGLPNFDLVNYNFGRIG